MTNNQNSTLERDTHDDSAPLSEHLRELRNRIGFAFGAVVIGFGLCFAFHEQLFRALVWPLMKSTYATDMKMIFTGVPELFFTYMKLSFMGGLFLAFPVLLFQVWRFIAPGLYLNEKKVILPFLIITPFLFYAGGAFTYFAVMPIAIEFFLQFQNEFIEPLPSVREYLAFLVKMVFAFGLAFELPVLLLLMARAGIVSSQSLAHARRYAIVLIFAAAAILTPPDPVSQLLLAVPMFILYEFSVWGAYFMERKAKQAKTDETDAS